MAPGDVIHLKGHSQIPADGRVLSCNAAFRVVEPHPTAHIVRVQKSEGDMIYSTHLVHAAEAYVQVTETGDNSSVGRTIKFATDTPNPPTQYLTDMPQVVVTTLLATVCPILVFFAL